jgi:hypothetical protein
LKSQLYPLSGFPALNNAAWSKLFPNLKQALFMHLRYAVVFDRTDRFDLVDRVLPTMQLPQCNPNPEFGIIIGDVFDSAQLVSIVLLKGAVPFAVCGAVVDQYFRKYDGFL